MYWMLRADVCLHLILNGFLNLSKCRPFVCALIPGHGAGQLKRLCSLTGIFFWLLRSLWLLRFQNELSLGFVSFSVLEIPGSPWKCRRWQCREVKIWLLLHVNGPELGIHWTVDSSYTEPGLNCTYVWWPWGLKRCVLYWWEVCIQIQF